MAEITMYNQDCIVAMQQIDTESIDLIVTDPPYNLGNFMKNRDTNLKKMRDNFFGSAGWDDMEFDEWSKSMDAFFKASARVMRKGGAMIMFMAIIKVETIIQLAEKHGFYYKTTGIWHKTNPMPRNMNLHFVNSTEAWIYFTYKKKTGTFNNGGAMFHDFIETSVTPNGERKRLGVYFVHESDLEFDDRAISPDNDLRGEYNVLLKAERDGNLTPEQKGRLFDIREALKKIRKFPEKVIKYLWDDAFKFNPEALFDTDNMESLEQVIRTFVYSTGRDRFKIFKPTVRSTFYPDSQA